MFWVKVNLSVDLVKSGQLTNIVDSVSTTNQQNLSTIKNVDLRKSHPHQQNWSIVQIVDSLLDPNQQSVSLKIGETTKCTLGFFLHNNKFVDQQSGSNVQIVVSGPTSTNCVIPNLPRGSRQLYQYFHQGYSNSTHLPMWRELWQTEWDESTDDEREVEDCQHCQQLSKRHLKWYDQLIPVVIKRPGSNQLIKNFLVHKFLCVHTSVWWVDQ